VRNIISRLYYAARIYFSSYGIAWFDLETFLKLLNFIERKRTVNAIELSHFLQKESFSSFAKTGKEGYYFIRLLWHLGLLVKEVGRNYHLSTYGKHILEELHKNPEERLEITRNIFRRWSPLITFLTYLKLHGPKKQKEIALELGNEMKYWTSMLYQLGITKKGNIAKPYNNFVISSLFVPLALELDLGIKKRGKIKLTREGDQFVRDYGEIPQIIRTMPGDYTIYAGVADVLYDAEEPVIVSPWVNGTLKNMVEVIGEVNQNLNKLTIVVRDTLKNRKFIKELENNSFDLEVRSYRNLHSKMTVNCDGPAIESSANLLATSLKRNYEVGTYYPKTPEELLLAVEELVSISKPLQI